MRGWSMTPRRSCNSPIFGIGDNVSDGSTVASLSSGRKTPDTSSTTPPSLANMLAKLQAPGFATASDQKHQPDPWDCDLDGTPKSVQLGESPPDMRPQSDLRQPSQVCPSVAPPRHTKSACDATNHYAQFRGLLEDFSEARAGMSRKFEEVERLAVAQTELLMSIIDPCVVSAAQKTPNKFNSAPVTPSAAATQTPARHDRNSCVSSGILPNQSQATHRSACLKGTTSPLLTPTVPPSSPMVSEPTPRRSSPWLFGSSGSQTPPPPRTSMRRDVTPTRAMAPCSLRAPPGTSKGLYSSPKLYPISSADPVKGNLLGFGSTPCAEPSKVAYNGSLMRRTRTPPRPQFVSGMTVDSPGCQGALACNSPLPSSSSARSPCSVHKWSLPTFGTMNSQRTDVTPDRSPRGAMNGANMHCFLKEQHRRSVELPPRSGHLGEPSNVSFTAAASPRIWQGTPIASNSLTTSLPVNTPVLTHGLSPSQVRRVAVSEAVLRSKCQDAEQEWSLREPSRATISLPQPAPDQLTVLAGWIKDELEALRQKEPGGLAVEQVVCSKFTGTWGCAGPTKVHGVGLVEGARSVARLLLPYIESSVVGSETTRQRLIAKWASMTPAT